MLGKFINWKKKKLDAVTKTEMAVVAAERIPGKRTTQADSDMLDFKQQQRKVQVVVKSRFYCWDKVHSCVWSRPNDTAVHAG